MKYFISAGEPSGDLHAAHLIAQINRQDPEAQWEFLGGDLMAHESGKQPVVHYRDMAFMGFSEVLRHLPQVLNNFKAAKRAVETFRPDAIILVDYPSFNLRIAKVAHRLGIPVYYYISPKVWAWKEHRVKAIKQYVRKVFCILPFEVDFYKNRHDYNVDYVGNPSVEEVDQKLRNCMNREEFLKTHRLPDKPIIALLPGSRKSEIKNNLAIMEEAAASLTDYQIVVAGAPGLDIAEYGFYLSPGVRILSDATFELLHHAQVALVTSGTATLECALMGTPQVVCYRSNGSKLTYAIMSKILKIPFVSLPNLIAGKEIVPEMLLHRCTPELVGKELNKILPGRPGYDNQQEGYELMRTKLGTSDCAATTARHLIEDLKCAR